MKMMMMMMMKMRMRMRRRMMMMLHMFFLSWCSCTSTDGLSWVFLLQTTSRVTPLRLSWSVACILDNLAGSKWEKAMPAVPCLCLRRTKLMLDISKRRLSRASTEGHGAAEMTLDEPPPLHQFSHAPPRSTRRLTLAWWMTIGCFQPFLSKSFKSLGHFNPLCVSSQRGKGRSYVEKVFLSDESDGLYLP